MVLPDGRKGVGGLVVSSGVSVMSCRSSSPAMSARVLIVPDVSCWSVVLSVVEGRLEIPSASVVRGAEDVPGMAVPGWSIRCSPVSAV
eukprot:9419746-Heterocapsa_arctica.AAC.1